MAVFPPAIPLDQLSASIAGSSPDAVIVRTSEGLISSWNPAAERLYGYSPNEAIGRPSTILVPSDRLAEERSIFERALRGQHTDRYETERLRRDGDSIAVSLALSPVWGTEEDVVGVLTIEHDITLRRRAALTVEELDRYFTSAFNDALIGMALISVDAGGLGRFMRVNKALCDLSGYPRDELERSEVEALTHSEDLEHELAAMARLLAGASEGYQLEERLVHAESHAIWVLVSTSLVRDAAGEPLYCIRQVQDIEERKRFEGQLGFLADHDPLTGLYNRRRFVRELSQRMAYARRYGSGGAVLFLDIDDFKYVNDTLGHKTGDEVISAVGCIVQQRVRVTDVLARLGGDEFGVLLPEASEEEAQILARGLAAAVREGSAPLVGEGRPHVTVSVGVSAFDRPRGELTADDILVEADLAMYAAKEDGRDRVALSSSEHKERMRARINWTERLSRAVEDDHFVLYCQPILDLSSGSVSQHELLLRLRGEGELILPASFLYTAERFGSILALDRWVLSRGMRLIAEQRAAGRQLRLEINLSGRSVTDPQLPEFIEQELEATAIDPASLILEVTETAAIANMDQARRFAARLGEIGCGFALDDFGAGFGSFYYLKHIPFDYVKIDGEFIRHLPASSTDQLILESIVGMCKGLGKRTIAEFVGDEKTVEVLREHDVDYAQGYHVGRPRPLSEALPT